MPQAAPARAELKTAMIVPEYGGQFRCIGPACEDTCCSGWRVPVDRLTYEKYQGLSAGELRTSMEENIVRVADGTASEENFAAIRLDGTRKCPFLTAERLCRIHAEQGEAWLTRVCDAFPRHVYSVDGIEQEPLMLACPEAARLVLLNPKLLQERSGGRAVRWSDPDGTRRPLQDYFWPIRAYALQLIRNRRYALWQRLCLLWIFCGRLDGLARGEDSRSFSAVLGDFSAAVDSGTLGEPLDRLSANSALQLVLVLSLLRLGIGDGERLPSARLRDCLRTFEEGIGGAGMPAEDRVVRYSTAHREIYASFFESRPHILENYLVNEVFRWVFPFGDAMFNRRLPVNCGRAFARLAIQFGVVRGVLIGVAGARGDRFAESDVVRTVQVISRQFEHHRRFADDGYALLASRGFDTLAGYVVLLRS